MKNGWDIKRLHKQIVMSGTYRQSSDATDDLLLIDPRNELYARSPRRRMTVEMVRDAALARSGLLVEKVGGESVLPYQPADIWNPSNSLYSYPGSEDVPKDAHHRRTLYSFIKRNAMHPGLTIFDAPDPNVSVARRSISNTPLQALELMNDPQYVEAYRALGQFVLQREMDRADQLALLYRIAARRLPTEEQLEILKNYFDSQLVLFSESPEKAMHLLDLGITKPDEGIDSMQLAAMTNVAAAVMNSPDAYTIW